MPFKVLEYAIWGLSSLLLLLTAAQLWRQGLRGTFRVFFAYLCLVGTHGLVNLYLSFTNPVWWFYSFYVGGLVTTILGFAVLYEVARAAISTSLFKLDTSTFMTFCALGAVLAVIVAANTDVQSHPFIRARILLEMALRVMQLTILAVFVAVSTIFGVFWRRVEFGIVLGYGIYAASQLSLMCFRASETRAQAVLVLAPAMSFCCASLIWLAYSSFSDLAVDVDMDTASLTSEIDRSLVAVQRMTQ